MYILREVSIKEKAGGINVYFNGDSRYESGFYNRSLRSFLKNDAPVYQAIGAVVRFTTADYSAFGKRYPDDETGRKIELATLGYAEKHGVSYSDALSGLFIETLMNRKTED